MSSPENANFGNKFNMLKIVYYFKMLFIIFNIENLNTGQLFCPTLSSPRIFRNP